MYKGVKTVTVLSRTLYYIFCRFRTIINGIGSNWQTLMVKPQNTTRFTVYNLEPDTTYEFKVLSRNQLGDGQFSETVTTKTLGMHTFYSGFNFNLLFFIAVMFTVTTLIHEEYHDIVTVCKVVNIFLSINLSICFGCSKVPSH